MIIARGSQGICIIKGNIFVCGGKDQTGNALKSLEAYTIATNMWNRLHDCPSSSIKPLLVPFNDKYIFKFSGITMDGSINQSIERYDISKNEWIECLFTIKEESNMILKDSFKFTMMMAGIQVNHNSILVLYK